MLSAIELNESPSCFSSSRPPTGDPLVEAPLADRQRGAAQREDPGQERPAPEPADGDGPSSATPMHREQLPPRAARDCESLGGRLLDHHRPVQAGDRWTRRRVAPRPGLVVVPPRCGLAPCVVLQPSSQSGCRRSGRATSRFLSGLPCATSRPVCENSAAWPVCRHGFVDHSPQLFECELANHPAGGPVGIGERDGHRGRRQAVVIHRDRRHETPCALQTRSVGQETPGRGRNGWSPRAAPAGSKIDSSRNSGKSRTASLRIRACCQARSPAVRSPRATDLSTRWLFLMYWSIRSAACSATPRLPAATDSSVPVPAAAATPRRR